MKILVVGDSYYTSAAFRTGLGALAPRHELEFLDVVACDHEPRDDSERGLAEYEGTSDQLREALTDHEVLIVHGAPVSRRVLEASPRLRLVCCARGGPVNVDIEAAKHLGVGVVTTPGKNAQAVADLTIALAIMLTRSVHAASSYLRDGGRVRSNFEGARYCGYELGGLTLGLIGFGRVGSAVCSLAAAFGMDVMVHDPFVDGSTITALGAHSVEISELVERSHLVSLHARQTSATTGLVHDRLLAQFRPGGYLINTARERLVDEAAVLAALRSRRLAGIGADVFESDGPFAEAFSAGQEGLILLPHIGGATHQTIERAARMIIDHIERFEKHGSEAVAPT